MEARWIDEWGGALRAGTRPRPAPEANEVLVEVEACGVGLTVINCMRGELARSNSSTPRIPGHEFVGRIAAVGVGVDPARVGQRVMAYFYLFCGRCRRCLAGHESLCEHLGGFVGVDVDGGYAPYAVLPDRSALALPDAIDAVPATAIPDAIATPVHVAALVDLGPGDRVVVIGAGGGVGVHMVQVARLHGAVVVGLEPDSRKRAFLSDELGVEAVDSSDFATTEMPVGWKRGADVVVDLVGREASLQWAIDRVREDGRVVVLTTFPDVSLTVEPRKLVFGQVSVVGSRYASRSELLLAAELVASGLVRPVVSAVCAPSEVERLHDRLVEGSLLGRGALLWNHDQEAA